MTVKAVFFDFDDTLGDREIYAYRCYRDILDEYADIQDPIEKEAILQHVMIWDQNGDVPKSYVVDMLQKTYGIQLDREGFEDLWASRLWQYAVPFSDAADTLSYLQHKYKLGIITNGPAQGQRRKLMQTGLIDFFCEEHIIVSGDHGIKKPDPRLFLTACKKIEERPEDCVFVGDIFPRDVLGAYRAGMRPIWVTADDRMCTVKIEKIRNIKELVKIL